MNDINDKVWGMSLGKSTDPHYCEKPCGDCRGHGTIVRVVLAKRSTDPDIKKISEFCVDCEGKGYHEVWI